MASLFLRLMLLKVLPNQLKIFDHFVRFDLLWAESAVSPAEKSGNNVNFLKSLMKSITKINAFLVITELMAWLGKVLRSLGDIGKKITIGIHIWLL